MGKMADNERLKITANFLNNVGVGLVLAGVVIPWLSLIPKWAAAHEKNPDTATLDLILEGKIEGLGGTAVVAAMALLIGLRLWREALRTLEDMTD